MKKFNKLQFNSERILKQDELISLKGGNQLIDQGWLTCRVNGVICWSASILSCDFARAACDAVCGSWSEAICAGN